MGGSQSTEIPGGGTEGYHVLKVKIFSVLIVFLKLTFRFVPNRYKMIPLVPKLV